MMHIVDQHGKTKAIILCVNTKCYAICTVLETEVSRYTLLPETSLQLGAHLRHQRCDLTNWVFLSLKKQKA